MSKSTFDATAQKLISSAFSNPNDQRTLFGIAMASGIARTVVEAYIKQHPELFRSTGSISGSTVISLTEKAKSGLLRA